MTEIAPYFRYWGKASQEAGGEEYHLLPYHCLDVAACGYWLVKNNQFGAAEIFKQLGFSLEDGAIFFAWLLALHDIGKFARGFQQLKVYPALVPPLSDKIYSSRHDTLGYWVWNARLRDEIKSQKWSPLKNINCYALDQFMELATGHHGKPPVISTEGICAFAVDDIQAVKAWMTDLSELFAIEYFPEQCSDKQWRKTILTRASWPLAGLIVLADWLGSDRKTFPFKTVRVRS